MSIKWISLAFLGLIFLYSNPSQAQMGVNTSNFNSYTLLEIHASPTKSGGLLLPQLSQGARDSLMLKSDWDSVKATGLVILNTSSACKEYWNGNQWISLCASTQEAHIGLSYFSDSTNEDITKKTAALGYMLFKADGTDSVTGKAYKDLLPLEVPSCTQSPPFTYAIVAGQADIQVVDAATGRFQLTVDANATALVHTCILRVVSNCTGDSKDYIFQQVPNTALCPSSATKPVIISVNGSSVLCQNGVVQLYLDSTKLDASAYYIWTLNGSQVSTGTSYTATSSGKYVVYEGAIGCAAPAASDAFVVTVANHTAPDAVSLLSANTTFCGAVAPYFPIVISACNLGTATKYSGTPADIHWIKDGVDLGSNGFDTLQAYDVGTYSAVVVDVNGCTSFPSNVVTLDAKSGTSILFADTDVTINGITADNNFTYCENGLLQVSAKSNQPTAVYTWYFNGVAVGQGANYTVILPAPVPSTATLSVTADVPGDANACPTTVTMNATGSSDVSAHPVLSAPYGAFICNAVGSTCELDVTLAAGAAAAKEYQWSRDGGPLFSTGVNPQYNATATGSYTAWVTTITGCLYKSDPITVKAFGAPSLSWLTSSTKVDEGVTYLYTLQNTGAPVTGLGYTWSTTNATASTNPDTISNNVTTVIAPTGNSAYIRFHTPSNPTTAYDQTITVTAHGDCGTAQLTANVNVISVVPNPPVVVLNGITRCGGASVTISNLATLTAVDPGVRIRWQASRDAAFSVLIPNVVGTGVNNEFCFVPFNSTLDTLYLEAQAIYSGGATSPYATYASNPISGAATTLAPLSIVGTSINGNVATPAPTCFDINSASDPNRTPVNFSATYEYSIPSASGPIQWSVKNGSASGTNGAQTVTNMAAVNASTGTTVSLSFDPALSTDQFLIDGGKYKVTLIAQYVNADNCFQQITTELTIQDQACCTGVTDQAGNYYTASFFGSACWMTQNLRRTIGTNRSSYFYPNNDPATVPYIGLLYANRDNSYCPVGWHIPSQADFEALDAEIAANSAKYTYDGNAATGTRGDIIGKTITTRDATYNSYSLAVSASNVDGGFDSPKPGVVSTTSGNAVANYRSKAYYYYYSSGSSTRAVYILGFTPQYTTLTSYAASIRCVRN